MILAASLATRVRDRARVRCSRRLFARRIRRLEAAAERIADGRFDEPVVDTAPDELGQLARAFERMRLRLASLDRARGEFIANASHELRTPLFSLAGFLELLGDRRGARRRDARGVPRSRCAPRSTRLTKLATDLLDLSRMDAGRLAVADESFDLAVVGDVLATEFGPRVAARRARCSSSTPAAPSYARADEARVLQIGRILVDNAIVHTPPGTAIRVERRRRGRPGDPDGLGRRAGDPRRGAPGRVRALLPARRARSPRAAGSASRSPGSSPS